MGGEKCNEMRDNIGRKRIAISRRGQVECVQRWEPHGKHTPQSVGKGAEEDDALECGRVALHEGPRLGQHDNSITVDVMMPRRAATGPTKAQRPAFA